MRRNMAIHARLSLNGGVRIRAFYSSQHFDQSNGNRTGMADSESPILVTFVRYDKTDLMIGFSL